MTSELSRSDSKTPQDCPNCGSEDWNVYNESAAEYTDEPGIQCAECGMVGHSGSFESDQWMWGWP